MYLLIFIGLIIGSYILGSIPFGLLFVKLSNGKDIREVASGRTGGTNAFRAAGFWAGLATATLDMLKGASTVWLARALLPGNPWIDTLAPVAAVVGHNYSIFLIERTNGGRIHLRGGAGGAPCVGGSFALWAPSFLVIVPIGAILLYFVGYASLTTISAALLSTFIFVYRAWHGLSPWEYAVYGLITTFLLVWALRPNIKRLIAGNERVVGLRSHREK